MSVFFYRAGTVMVRNYKKLGTVPAKQYTPEELEEAVLQVQQGEPMRHVSRNFKIPRRTLRNHVSGENPTSHVGRKPVLLPEEERSIAQHAATFSDYGYPFTVYDIRQLVQSFLDKAGRNVECFKENLPGEEWVRLFLARHKDLLSKRMCQNISRKRAAVSCESVSNYFDNLETSLADIPPENILNYDETNLTDDPRAKLMLFRKGAKHAERVMNSSKSSVSIMFACAANGHFVPPYVVYKAERMMDTWVHGGPCNTRYNRSKSGWFDAHCFTDWVDKVAVPYFRHLPNDAARILIGDNLACHLSADVIELCASNNIKMIFLPPNSTHLLQPLDVAVYGPMKAEWRKVLTEWKQGLGRYCTTLPKVNFPSLLFTLLSNMDQKEQFAINGFKTTGIYPLNRDKVLSKLTKGNVPPSSQQLVSPMLIEHLSKLREAAATKPGAVRRGRAIQVEPGKSVSVQELEPVAGPSGSKPATKRNPKRKQASDSSDESSISEDPLPSLGSLSGEEAALDPSTPPSSRCQPQPQQAPKRRAQVRPSYCDDSSTDESVDGLSLSEDELGIDNATCETSGTLEKEAFIQVQFGEKKVYHHVGKILEKSGNTGNSWVVRYYRRCYGELSTKDSIAFKEPANPDIYETNEGDIVKVLPKPSIIKGRMVFPDVFDGVTVR